MRTELEHARTALYRFYDAADRLLYVGITHNVEQRWTSHARNQPWWLDVARKTVEWHPSRSMAEELESAAIERETPLYDRSGNRWGKDGCVVDERLALETDRAVAVLSAAIDDGTFPPWKVMPTIGELSERFLIPLVAVTKALSHLENSRGQIVRFWDRFVPGSPDEVSSGAAGKYGGVYILASRRFPAEPFSLAQLASETGYAVSTVEQHLRKLVKARVVEKSPRSGPDGRLFRVTVPPVPDPPRVLAVWSRSDVHGLVEWLNRQIQADGDVSDRDCEIVNACLPDEYGVSTAGVRVLKVMARRYQDRPGCLPEWGVSKGAAS